MLISRTHKCYLIREKGLYWCDLFKDLEMGRLSCIIWVHLKSNHSVLIRERHREIWHRDTEEKATWPHRLSLEWYSHKPRNASCHQKLEEGQGTDSSVGPSEGVQSCRPLDFRPVKLVLNFWPSEWLENEFLVLSHQGCNNLLHSPQKLIETLFKVFIPCLTPCNWLEPLV